MIQKNSTDRAVRKLLLFAICLALSGCSSPAEKNTIRLVNSSGVSEQPSGYSSYDPSTAIPDEDPEGRIPALEALAKENPAAAYDLGLRFFRGDGVPQDNYRALQWMTDAAERGDLDAQKAVGRLYLTGLEEMGADPQEAERWLTIAARRGDREAEKLLKEASEAKKTNQDNYSKWRDYWRPRFYRSWYHDYPYRGYWRGSRWYYH